MFRPNFKSFMLNVLIASSLAVSRSAPEVPTLAPPPARGKVMSTNRLSQKGKRKRNRWSN